MAEQLHPEDIYQTLEYEIVTLKIKPGETISENQLCKRFGISRTPVRAALQRLEQNGFVQIIPCKGTIVTPIDLDIVDQIVYQRTAVESTVLRDFIQVCSPKEYIEIKHKYDLLEEMAQTMTDPDNVDINAFLTLDLEMHAIWFCSMNKWYIWQNLTKPQPDYSRFTRLDVVRANNVPDVLSEHREILRVIREKDLDAIEPLIRRHLYGGLRRMGTQLYAEKYRPYFTGIRSADHALHIRAVHQFLQDAKLLFGGRRHQILPLLRQNGQICDTPLDVFGIVDIGRCQFHQMTNAPAYQIAVALQITVLTASRTEDFCVGHGHRGLFCYN